MTRKSLLRRAALAALLLAAPVAGRAADKPIPVVISQAFQSMLYLPFYVAIDQGFFTQQGVAVDKETAGSPPSALSAVISGSADFSIHGPEWTAIAASKGAKVGIVANLVNGAAVWIAAAPDFQYDGVASLKGQRVVTGAMPTTSTSLFMKLAKEGGLDAKTDVDMIPVQIGSEPGPFLAGQAKVAVMYEPGLEQAVSRGMKVVVGFPKAYGPYAFSSLTARTGVDPDKAQRVVNALELAIRFMHADTAATLAIARREFPSLAPVVVDAAVTRMLAEDVYPTSVQTTPEALTTAMQTQIALGNLAAQPDYAQFVVQTYVAKALLLP
ncbi:MAG: ABC transporter substrate-binding protein [Janthinobacterium lividum]